MEIKKLVIHDYGPLESLEFDFCSGLNVIFGPNGSGKTPAIEGFLKLLLGKKKSKQLESKKLREYPSGKVVIEDEKVEWTFKGHHSIDKASRISAKDLENIFVNQRRLLGHK
ncbi:MAG: AAA family ATPase [Candidatus Heimdallarchaeota archaeon]